MHVVVKGGRRVVASDRSRIEQAEQSSFRRIGGAISGSLIKAPLTLRSPSLWLRLARGTGTN